MTIGHSIAYKPHGPCSQTVGLGWGCNVHSIYFDRCLANLLMKQQVTVAMMTTPTKRADDTPTTRGMSRRSMTGGGKKGGKLTQKAEIFQQLHRFHNFLT